MSPKISLLQTITTSSDGRFWLFGEAQTISFLLRLSMSLSLFLYPCITCLSCFAPVYPLNHVSDCPSFSLFLRFHLSIQLSISASLNSMSSDSLQTSQARIVSETHAATFLSYIYLHMNACFTPQKCVLFRHPHRQNYQDCSRCEVLLTFRPPNLPAPQRPAIVHPSSPQMAPHPSLHYLSTLLGQRNIVFCDFYAFSHARIFLHSSILLEI